MCHCDTAPLDTAHVLQDCPLRDIPRLAAWPEEQVYHRERQRQAKRGGQGISDVTLPPAWNLRAVSLSYPTFLYISPLSFFCLVLSLFLSYPFLLSEAGRGRTRAASTNGPGADCC